MLEACGGLLGPTPQGGVGESAGAAGAVGGALWLAAGAAAWRLRRKLGFLLGGFAGAYVVGLVLLATLVAPAMWGPLHCEGGYL